MRKILIILLGISLCVFACADKEQPKSVELNSDIESAIADFKTTLVEAGLL